MASGEDRHGNSLQFAIQYHCSLFADFLPRAHREGKPMHVELAWGRQSSGFDIPDEDMVATRRGAAVTPVSDVPGAVRRAVEEPLHFPALRRALTPDDHIAIAVDEHLP